MPYYFGRSDRSHMRKADGSWIAEPPPWLPLLGDSLSSSPTSMPAHESANNLDSFIDMTQTNDFGEVLSLPELSVRFRATL